MSDTAQAIFAARRAPRALFTTLPEAIRPRTHDEGVAAQVALSGLMGAPAGFKIGATTAAMQTYLGLPGPIAGFMLEADLHGDGSTLAYAGFLRPGVECELAVHLAHDIPPGPCTRAAAMAAVGGLMAGIELVENRYADLGAFGTPSLVADRAFHACAVLGAPYEDWRTLDLLTLRGTISKDGMPWGEGLGRELLGDPMLALAWLAGSAEIAAFGGLRAGQVVMLGSVTLPLWLDGPCTITVAFPPLPSVTLRLAG